MRLFHTNTKFGITRRLCFVFLLILTGCSTTPDGEDSNKPAEQLHTEGVEALQQKKFKEAVERFQELDRKHPFSPFALRAQVDLIYAQYKREEWADAISMAERFIRLHPKHPYVSYAYYMRGLSFYKQISSATQDQGNTRDALLAFQELVSRFPKSDYAWEAEQMILLCKDRLAEQEIFVARYYLDQEEYIAAANRFNQIVVNPMYNATPYVEEALFGLVLTSKQLGLTEEAINHATVLGHNFPDRPLYRYAVALIEHNKNPSRSELAQLRKGTTQHSLLQRIFQGVAPAATPNQKDF